MERLPLHDQRAMHEHIFLPAGALTLQQMLNVLEILLIILLLQPLLLPVQHLLSPPPLLCLRLLARISRFILTAYHHPELLPSFLARPQLVWMYLCVCRRIRGRGGFVLFLLLALAKLHEVGAQQQISADDPDEADPALGLEAGEGTVEVVDEVVEVGFDYVHGGWWCWRCAERFDGRCTILEQGVNVDILCIGRSRRRTVL